jgi:LacI family transcriptional regulator, galactose operon repressor
MASIKVVARHAGVSIATVSRVLNGTKYVSPDAHARVVEAIKALNYQPNVPARSLRRQQTQSIGVLVPLLNDFYFSNLAFVIENALSSQGYSPLFASTEEDPTKESACVDILIQNRVMGAIFVPSLPVNHSVKNIRRLIESGISVVLVDRGLKSLKVNQVMSNNYQGGYDAVHHLIELGHQHIGIIDTAITGATPKFGPGHDRINGARQALSDSGMRFRSDLLFIGKTLNVEAGYRGALKLLRESPEMSAIFALTDACAMGVLRAAFELGLNVPRDLSVVGFDDIPLASHMIPRLTTLIQPTDKIGRTAAELLLRQIEEPAAPFQTVMVGTQLVVRESTAPPPLRVK